MTPTKEHGSIGENVKVHFAGSENVEFGYILHDAGVNYFLFTVLPFIMDQFDIKWGRITLLKTTFPNVELPKIAKHVIMDSGLFTLMFGACKHIRPDEKFIRRYKDAICNFVNSNQMDKNVACVECDCQKLLGTDLAWELLFYILAFYPTFSMGQIVSMGLATCLLEIVIGICDTPFLYLAKRMKYGDEIQ